MPSSLSPPSSSTQSLAITASAEISALGPDRVLKLFHEGWPAAAAQREASAARIARAAGVSTPAVIETIEVNGRPGIVFERCDATSMLERLLASPDTWPQLADRLASLHAAMHTRSGAGLPRQRERLHDAVVRAAALGQSARQAVLTTLARREDGGILCHGDFNPAQVVGPEAAPVVLDWFDATCGDPAADVATTLIALRHAALPATLGPRDHAALDALRHAFAERYLSGYRTRRRLDDDAMHVWLPIAAAARLGRCTDETERAALLGIVGEFLKEG